MNGVAVKHAGALGKDGWSYEGNTLTTVIPVPRGGVERKVIIEVRRDAALMAKRSELDGFAGAMTRLRGAYDAMQKTSPVSAPPDPLIDAMQTGDRLGYHPGRAQQEIAHFHEVLPKAKAAVDAIGATFNQVVDERIKRFSPKSYLPGGVDLQTEKQRRLESMAQAEKLVEAARK